MIDLQENEKRLLDLLKINSRMSAAELGRKLGLARSTIHMMLTKLEDKIIDSYTIRLKKDPAGNKPGCYVLITRDPKRSTEIEVKMHAMAEVVSLVTVAGPYDFIALVCTEDYQSMDSVLTAISMMDGIIKTESHVILSTKFDRQV